MNKKIVGVILVSVILVSFILGISSVLAYNYFASNISYIPSDKTWNVSNVSDALDDLKGKSKQHVILVVGGDYTVPFTGMSSYVNIDNKVPKKFKITAKDGEPNLEVRCYTKRWDTYTVLNMNTEYLSSSCISVAGYVSNSNYYWANFTIDFYN